MWKKVLIKNMEMNMELWSRISTTILVIFAFCLTVQTGATYQVSAGGGYTYTNIDDAYTAAEFRRNNTWGI